MIRTEEGWKNYYKDYSYNQQGLKTFGQAYTDIGLAEKAAIGSTTYDYNKAMIEAYKSAQEQSNAITASNLGQGFKDRELLNIDEQLANAYSSYQQNYASAVSSIEESAAESRQQITNAIENEAHNASLVEQSLKKDYLNYLWQSTRDDEVDMFETNEWWKRFTTEEDGERRLLTETELDNLLYEKNNELSDLLSSNTDIRELNMLGVDFYDRLMHGELDDSSLLNYETWLQNQSVDKKSEYYGLYDWYSGYNPYSTDYDEHGIQSNRAFVKTGLGMVSSDKSWQMAERFGGFTEQELSSRFDTFKNRYDNIQSLVEKKGKDKPGKVYDELESMLSDIKSLAYEFGIEDDLENVFSAYEGAIKEARSNVHSGADMAQEFFGPFASISGAGAATGLAIGGPIGAAIGAAIASVFGAGSGGEEVDKSRKENLSTAQTTKDLFNDVLTQMINYSMYKRKEAEIEFYKNKK